MTAFVPSGYLTFSDALDHVASVLHIQKREAQQTLRQLLYSGQVPSRIIERSGQKPDTPTHVWGGMQWDEALKLGAVCFEIAAYAPDACGRVIIPEAALKTALKYYGVTRINERKRPDDAGPAIHKKIKTLERNQEIYDLYTATSKKNPRQKKIEIYHTMRTERPNLFESRRTVGRKKGISNQTVERIITAQQRR